MTNSGDQVALAVDGRPKAKFPLPFAQRTPSFTPKNIVPSKLPSDAAWSIEAIDDGKPASDRWAFYAAGITGFAMLTVALAVCFFWRG